MVNLPPEKAVSFAIDILSAKRDGQDPTADTKEWACNCVADYLMTGRDPLREVRVVMLKRLRMDYLHRAMRLKGFLWENTDKWAYAAELRRLMQNFFEQRWPAWRDLTEVPPADEVAQCLFNAFQINDKVPDVGAVYAALKKYG